MSILTTFDEKYAIKLLNGFKKINPDYGNYDLFEEYLLDMARRWSKDPLIKISKDNIRYSFYHGFPSWVVDFMGTDDIAPFGSSSYYFDGKLYYCHNVDIFRDSIDGDSWMEIEL